MTAVAWIVLLSWALSPLLVYAYGRGLGLTRLQSWTACVGGLLFGFWIARNMARYRQ